MNRIYFAVLSLVVVLFTSCQDQDVSYEHLDGTIKINFTDNLDQKSSVNNINSLANFGVFAYHTGRESINDYLSTGRTLVADWMFNQEVEFKIPDGYVYSPVRYWPSDPQANITFCAYAPLNSPNLEILSPNAQTKVGVPIYSYTVNAQNPSEDFLVSHPAYDLTSSSGGVKFIMQHVLSRIRFNVKSSASNVRIKSIGLKNVYTKAVFNTIDREWHKQDLKRDLVTYLIPESEQLMTDQFRMLKQVYKIVPQVVDQVDKPIFTLVFDDNGVEYSKEFSPLQNWDSYSSYNYNITYTSGQIEVVSQVEPWQVNNVSDVIIANQYLFVSSRVLDLAKTYHIYFNSSYPSTSISSVARYSDGVEFNLYDYYNVYFEGQKVRLEAKTGVRITDKKFTMYIQGEDLHGHVLVTLPIVVLTDQDEGVEISNVFWAGGNIISTDGYLDIAPSANYSGLYFRWGSLIGLAGNNAGSFKFDPSKSIGFVPVGYKKPMNKWENVPYEKKPSIGSGDAFIGKYSNGLGYEAESGLGDPCRYMSNQKGWTKGKWRMPTLSELDEIVMKRKVRRINGTWGVQDENHIHETATTGVLPVEAGWFIKADTTDVSIPSDSEFNTVKPPKGWIFLPASGQRGGWSEGMMSEFSTRGYYWTATTPAWAGAAHRLQFGNVDTGDNKGSFNDPADGTMHAFPIRCVRDK